MNDQDIKLGLYIEAAHKERAIKKSQGGCCFKQTCRRKKNAKKWELDEHIVFF